MAQAPDKVRSLIEPVVVSMGYELVGVEYLAQGKHSLLRVYIDKNDGITVDDCGRVSHQLSGLLDVEDVIRGHYYLEISSPGLDRPLFSPEHYQRFIGEQIKVKLNAALAGSDRKKFKGVIREVADNSVTLEVDDEEIEIPFQAIDKANLVPEF